MDPKYDFSHICCVIVDCPTLSYDCHLVKSMTMMTMMTMLMMMLMSMMAMITTMMMMTKMMITAPDKDKDDYILRLSCYRWWQTMTIAMIFRQWLLMIHHWERTHISCLLSENEAQMMMALGILFRQKILLSRKKGWRRFIGDGKEDE